MIRSAIIDHTTDLDRVRAFLPSNYQAVRLAIDTTDVIYIVGVDRMGWTLDDYVIPRLASGNLYAKEVVSYGCTQAS